MDKELEKGLRELTNESGTSIRDRLQNGLVDFAREVVPPTKTLDVTPPSAEIKTETIRVGQSSSATSLSGGSGQVPAVPAPASRRRVIYIINGGASVPETFLIA